MNNYEWKQWKGFKKLHAVKLTCGSKPPYASFYVSKCGVAPFFTRDIFIEPPKTITRCKNCERELNGK